MVERKYIKQRISTGGNFIVCSIKKKKKKKNIYIYIYKGITSI